MAIQTQQDVAAGLTNANINGVHINEETAGEIAEGAEKYMSGFTDKIESLKDPEKMAEQIKAGIMGNEDLSMMMGLLEKVAPGLHGQIMGAMEGLGGNLQSIMDGKGFGGEGSAIGGTSPAPTTQGGQVGGGGAPATKINDGGGLPEGPIMNLGSNGQSQQSPGGKPIPEGPAGVGSEVLMASVEAGNPAAQAVQAEGGMPPDMANNLSASNLGQFQNNTPDMRGQSGGMDVSAFANMG